METIWVTKEEYDRIMEMIERPAKPTQELKDLMKGRGESERDSGESE